MCTQGTQRRATLPKLEPNTHQHSSLYHPLSPVGTTTSTHTMMQPRIDFFTTAGIWAHFKLWLCKSKCCPSRVLLLSSACHCNCRIVVCVCPLPPSPSSLLHTKLHERLCALAACTDQEWPMYSCDGGGWVRRQHICMACVCMYVCEGLRPTNDAASHQRYSAR